MSGTFPTTVNFSTLQFKDNRPTLLNQTLSGKKQVRQIGAQYFSFSVQLPPLNQEDVQTYFAFLQKQNGSFEDFLITPPLDNLGAAKNNANVKVVGSQVVGDSQIELDGFTANQTNAFKAGDLIKFANHSKVYMIRSNVDADGSGALDALISPPLIATLADNEVVTCNKPPFTVYLESDELVYSTNSSGFYSISFDVREVIPNA